MKMFDRQREIDLLQEIRMRVIALLGGVGFTVWAYVFYRAHLGEPTEPQLFGSFAPPLFWSVAMLALGFLTYAFFDQRGVLVISCVTGFVSFFLFVGVFRPPPTLPFAQVYAYAVVLILSATALVASSRSIRFV